VNLHVDVRSRTKEGPFSPETAWSDPCESSGAEDKDMSQRDVERALGRMLTDTSFRRDFFRNPARACLELGVQLAPHEVDALLRLPPRRLASLAGELDGRICRFHLDDSNDGNRSMEDSS
jgi:hypothetical protein